MHYPDTTFMMRTFELAKKCLGFTMLPYIRVNDNTFLSYNNISITKAENNQKDLVKEDIFMVSVSNNGYVPEDYFKQGIRVFWDQILGDLRHNL
jgi:hypothetical protein